MLETVKAEKVDEKRFHLFSSHVPFLNYGPLIVEKIALFLILC